MYVVHNIGKPEATATGAMLVVQQTVCLVFVVYTPAEVAMPPWSFSAVTWKKYQSGIRCYWHRGP